MTEKYNHKEIEKKWQARWEKAKVFEADNSSSKPKFYGLIEFPFASGQGMHAGHLRSNTAMDIIARKRRAEGYNVLYPIGWDAFGLPTENYAIKTGQQPSVITRENTDAFRKQLKSAGFSFDWTREVDTSDPAYYKWTQWIFLKFFEQGLAYKKKMAINWCPKDKIGLANEEVIDGKCERCGTPVEKREKEQWMLAITKYADRLDRDLDTVDYLPQIKTQQRNWIGRSVGAEIKFAVDKHDITVFTTRPDTLFGVTFIAVSPELAKTWLDIGWPAPADIQDYIKKTLKDRVAGDFQEKEKTGISAGFDAINPVNKEKVPIWIVNYVLGDVGTGAIMGVPAHDERDHAFAKKYGLPIKEVIMPLRVDMESPPRSGKKNVERTVVHAIVRNPKTGKILCLKWKKFPWQTIIIGGIEKGETPEEAGRREVLEETGYKNLKLVKVLGGEVKAEFFAAHKDENRIAYTTAVLYELVDDSRDKVAEEELTKHESFWGTINDVRPCAEVDVWKDRLNDIEYYTGEGILINSGKFNGKNSEQARVDITKAFGETKVTYKLKDWIFSRQRYWGEPIPLVYCENCSGWVAVPEKDLPITLPKVENYQPTDTGESPLSKITDWVNTKCPKCGGPARRETDTMPNWAGSSWYYLRYTDPKNAEEFASKKLLKKWTPVDWYNGGMEHTTLHLLYSRFWHKFLFDQGLVPTSEPYKKRTAHGLILASDGEKMSKSRGNVVNPDELIKTFGADALRLYEMFIGPFDQAVSWSDDGSIGTFRFLERIWRLQEKVATKKTGIASAKNDPKTEILLNQTIAKVSADIETMHFNTAISAMMILANELEKAESIPLEWYKTLLQLIAPFAPHIAEELWTIFQNKGFVHEAEWPKADVSKMESRTVVIAVQVNGKVRSQFEVNAGISENEAKNRAISDQNVKRYLEGKEIKKVIFVPNKLINLVI